MSFGNTASAAMVGLGINDHDYSMSLQHGHPQAMSSNVRNVLINDPHRQAPRSVPQNLNLAIPRVEQHWMGIGGGIEQGNHDPGSSSSVQLPPGYHEPNHQGYY